MDTVQQYLWFIEDTQGAGAAIGLGRQWGVIEPGEGLVDIVVNDDYYAELVPFLESRGLPIPQELGVVQEDEPIPSGDLPEPAVPAVPRTQDEGVGLGRRAAAPAARALGAVFGVAEELASLQPTPTAEVDVSRPGDEKFRASAPAVPGTTGTVSMYDMTEQELQRILEDSAGQGLGGLTMDLVQDVRNNIVGILQLMALVTGYDLQDQDGRGTFTDFLKSQAQLGRDVGRMGIGGFVGGTAAFLANPMQAAEAQPFSTATMVLPWIKSAMKAGQAVSPALVRLGEKAETIRLMVKNKLPAGDARAQARRTFSDAVAQPRAGEERIVEKVVRGGEREKERFEGASRELGQEAVTGRVGPLEALEDVPEGTLQKTQAMRPLAEDPIPMAPAAQSAYGAAIMAPTTAPGTPDMLGAAFGDAHTVSQVQNAWAALDRLEVMHKALFTRTKKVDQAVSDNVAARFDLDYESASDLAAAYQRYESQHVTDIYDMGGKANRRLTELDKATPSLDALPPVAKSVVEEYGWEALPENMKQALGITGDPSATPEYKLLTKIRDRAIKAARMRAEVEFMHDNILVPRRGYPLTHAPYEVTLEVPRSGSNLQVSEELAQVVESLGPSELIRQQYGAYIVPSKAAMEGDDLALVQKAAELARMAVWDAEPITKVPSLKHPAFAGLASELSDAMERGGMRRWDYVQTPQKDPALRGMDSLLSAAPALLTKEERLGIVSQAFIDTSNQMLRSPKMRQAVIKYLYNDHPHAAQIKKQLTPERLEAQLSVMSETTLLERPITYKVVLRDKRVDALTDLAEQNAQQSMRESYLGSLGKTFEELTDAEKQTLENLQTAAGRNTRELARRGQWGGGLEDAEDANSLAMQVRRSGGLPVVNLREAFLDTIDTMGKKKPKLLRKARQEVVHRVGALLSEKVAYGAAKHALFGELKRFPPQELNVFTDSLVQRVVKNGEAKPLFLMGVKPKDIGEHMESLAERLAEKHQVPVEDVIRLSKEMRRDFGDGADFPELAEVLPINEAQLRSIPGGVPITQGELAPPYSAISKGLASSLGWQLKASRAIRTADTWFTELVQGYKGNLTILNLASHKNNFLANLGYRMLQSGRGPGEIAFRLGKAGYLHQLWKAGKADPATKRAMAALDRTGLLDTTLLEGEIGALSESGLMGRLGKRIQEAGGMRLGRQFVRGGKAWKYVNEQAGKAYKLGDNLFKLDMALENFQKLNAKLDSLEGGEYMEFMVDPRRKVRLDKGEDGVTRIYVRNKDQLPGEGRQMPDEMLDEFLARGAGKPAQDVFFDYSDVPNFLHMLRASKVGGVVSPYLTWAWKAMDIPGVKKGLVGHLLSGDGGVAVKTNSRSVNFVQAQEAARAGMRRSLIMNVARQQVIEDPTRDIQKVFDYLPSESRMLLVQELTDPTYLSFSRQSGANWFEPTETLFQTGAALWAKLNGDDAESLFDPKHFAPAFPGATHGSFKPESRSSQFLGNYLQAGPESRQKMLEGIDVDGGYEYLWEPGKVKELLNRRDLWRKHATGETLSMRESLGLIGMSGTPLVEGMFKVFDAWENGADDPTALATRTFGPLLVGATPYAMIDVVSGSLSHDVDTAAAMSTRRWARSEVRQEDEQWLRWSIRRLTGLGWRSVKTERFRDNYLQKAEKALHRAIRSGEKERLQIVDADIARAKEKGEPLDELHKDRKLLTDKMDWMETVVSKELDYIRDNYYAVQKKLILKGGKKK